ncbi:MAG: polyprenol phosphomannose-dependent alpha 1,6 mannosyltransferase MptB [Acidimicrobiales bacterium]
MPPGSGSRRRLKAAARQHRPSHRHRGGHRRRLDAPVLLGPPLLSNDVYSYAAQGEMASRGIDPTSVGPVALGRGDFLRAVDPVWKTAPAPYGPVWIATSNAVVQAAGHDPAASVWLFRIVIVAGVVMAAVGVASIARSCGVDRPYALAVGIANPLVILYLIGGYHNDALMMGLLCLGVAAAMKDKRILAVVLLTLATAVKLPAIAALLVVGWVWAGKGAPFTKRVASVAKVMVPAVAVLAVLSVATGIGIGWITALRSTGKVMDTFSFMTMLGYFGSDFVNLVGLSDNPEIAVAPVRFLGLLAGLGISYWLMARADRIGIPRAVGLGMCALVLLGPVMWPWYLPAGFALIAAAGLGRFRPSYMVVVVAISALVWPTSVNPVEFLTRYQRILSFSVIVLIALAAWGAQWLAARRHHRRVAGREARQALLHAGAELEPAPVAAR